MVDSPQKSPKTPKRRTTRRLVQSTLFAAKPPVDTADPKTEAEPLEINGDNNDPDNDEVAGSQSQSKRKRKQPAVKKTPPVKAPKKSGKRSANSAPTKKNGKDVAAAEDVPLVMPDLRLEAKLRGAAVMNMDAASSSSTDVDVLPQQHKYDVFLSFRGPDTRLKFTSHLYAALKRKNILTYMDDKSLEKGDTIGPALLTAIEQSKVSIIVFSQDYASSTWCLDELVNIMRCEEAFGQLVVPVFYDIDPSDVRWQQRSYADSFFTLEERFKDDLNKVQTWRDVLTRAANLSGFDSQSNNIRNENEFVENIVKYVLLKLNRKSSVSTEGLVGMESNIRQLESLLRIHAQDVSYRAVGIWGMGGCGKTTLADVVFHRNSSEFQVCAFMANVRERSEKQGLYQLRNELLCKLLNEEHLIIDAPSIGSSFITDRLSRTRVLAVFDDVSDLTQLEFLLDQIRFGPRSRIIITTRNKRLLKKRVQEKHIYKMNLLSENKALELFQSIAIEDDGSQEDYLDLSLKVVRYTGCNPLALKVLASSFLHCKSKTVWEQELKKLERFPNNKVQNALRLCYDGLEDNEKGIFLDIACFLNGENRCDAEKLLEMHGFSPLSGLEVLIDMSLISIKDDRVQMHDLLQEMGKAIESGAEEVGKRKRLWNATNFYQILNNNSGTSVVEAIYLDMSKIDEVQLSPKIFNNMQNLKILKFYAPPEVHEKCKRQKRSNLKGKQASCWLPHLPIVKTFQCLLARSRIWYPLRSMLGSYEKVSDYDYEVFQKYRKLYFPRGLESFPEELRYLHWEGYPFKSLPSKYFPENLVEIRMPCSQVKQLWSNGQSLRSLKHLTLSNSEQLTEVPDLTGSPYIERIDLSGCTSLVEVPTYFQNLVNLTHLYLNYCKSLKILKGVPCNIKSLCMPRSGIEQLPSSLLSCEKLRTLDLGFCPYLRNLDSSKLDVYGGDRKLLSESTELQKRPSSLSSVVGCLIPLRTLDLAYSRLSEIPDSLISLSTLEYLNLSGTMIEGIPTSIMNVSGLQGVVLAGCKKLQSLPELPSLLQCLDVSECTSLMSVASSRVSKLQPWGQYKGATGYPWWQWFNFTGCWELDESSRNNILDDAQLRIIRMASLKQGRSSTVICPGSEIPKWMGYKREGCEINIKHPHHQLDTAMEEEYPHCLGFAISVVLAEVRVVFPRNDYPIHPLFELVCDFNCKTNDDSEGHQRKFYRFLWGNFEEDHVVVMFFDKDMCLDMKLKNKKKKLGSDFIPYWNPANKLTEASVRLYPTNRRTRGDEEVEEAGIEVKRCGFQWLHDETV